MSISMHDVRGVLGLGSTPFTSDTTYLRNWTTQLRRAFDSGDMADYAYYSDLISSNFPQAASLTIDELEAFKNAPTPPPVVSSSGTPATAKAKGSETSILDDISSFAKGLFASPLVTESAKAAITGALGPSARPGSPGYVPPAPPSQPMSSGAKLAVGLAIGLPVAGGITYAIVKAASGGSRSRRRRR